MWRAHFDKISTLKHKDEYDEPHYANVTERVNSWLEEDDMSPFLDTPFTYDEIESAVSRLHLGKAPGYDNITTEHIRCWSRSEFCSPRTIYIACIRIEYVP